MKLLIQQTNFYLVVEMLTFRVIILLYVAYTQKLDDKVYLFIYLSIQNQETIQMFIPIMVHCGTYILGWLT